MLDDAFEKPPLVIGTVSGCGGLHGVAWVTSLQLAEDLTEDSCASRSEVLRLRLHGQSFALPFPENEEATSKFAAQETWMIVFVAVNTCVKSSNR